MSNNSTPYLDAAFRASNHQGRGEGHGQAGGQAEGQGQFQGSGQSLTPGLGHELSPVSHMC
jgi:hypothetical protein